MKYELNAQQRSAVKARNKKILCLAGAGTGKTRTMIERIVSLVDKGVNPSEILALTFTNAAAFEMKARYKEYKPDGEIPEFRTFHSFCYNLLSSNRAILEKLGYKSMPSIAEDDETKRIRKQALAQLGIKVPTKKDPNEPLTALEKHNIDLLNKAQKRMMKQKNIITFDDLCSKVCQLFIDNDPLIKEYQDKYKYIHVDEYQDTDQIQHDFVMSFANIGKYVFVVGDALQSIYSFRGAVPKIIKGLAEDPAWKTIRLEVNYRSTRNICEYANRFSKRYASETYRIPIVSDREGEDVYERQQTITYGYGNVDDKLISRIAAECKVLKDESVAILCRTNAECSTIKQHFTENQIPFVTGKKDKEALHILKSAADDVYMTDWLSTFLTSEKYSEYIRLSTIKESQGIPYAGSEFMKDFGMHKAINERAEIIYCVRKISQENRSLYDRSKDICTLVGYPKLNVDMSGVTKLSVFLQRIREEVEKAQEDSAEIYIGTIHSVKGLEYDTVYVLGVDGPSFKLVTEEDKNVFYVAATRAKNRLIVYKC